MFNMPIVLEHLFDIWYVHLPKKIPTCRT